MSSGIGDLVVQNTSTVGTGSITLTTAVAPYMTAALAGFDDGDIVDYSIVDGIANSESAWGVLGSTKTTLTRNTVRSTNSNSPISLSGAAVVRITPLKRVFDTLLKRAPTRNFILGGDFSTNPWQRGTTFTAAANNTRFSENMIWIQSGTGVVDIKQTADAPTIAQAGMFTQHCLHIDCTTADASLAASDVYCFVCSIEGSDSIQLGFGQTGAIGIVLSFLVKSTKTGIFSGSVRNSAGNRAYVFEYTVNTTNTWEYKSIIIPADTTGTWLYTAGTVGMLVTFAIALGSAAQAAAGSWGAGNFLGSTNQVNGMDSASNDFKVALIQDEPGVLPTPFEALSISDVLQRAQRFYCKSFPIATAPAQALGAGVSGYINFTSQAAQLFAGDAEFPVRMCKLPTPVTYNPVSANANWRDISNSADRTVGAVNASESNIEIQASVNGVANAQNIIHWSAQADLA